MRPTHEMIQRFLRENQSALFVFSSQAMASQAYFDITSYPFTTEVHYFPNQWIILGARMTHQRFHTLIRFVHQGINVESLAPVKAPVIFATPKLTQNKQGWEQLKASHQKYWRPTNA